MPAFSIVQQAKIMTNISSAHAAAQLGDNHGYRFDGDFVHLNAEVIFSDADLSSGKAWALQLWASDCGFSGADLAGVKVAEFPIVAVAGFSTVAGCCAAMPPAGVADHVLGLALVAYAADGSSEVCDLAIYASRETFQQPCLLGEVSCSLANGGAELSVETIVNPRSGENLSGTLTLEVWALDAPYAGGSWTGIPVASLVLGVLAGGDEWSACHFTVPAALPPEAALLTVMLREWTPSGYLTRDFRNIASAAVKPESVPLEAPVIVAEPAVEVISAIIAQKPAKSGKASPAKVKKESAEPAKVKKAAVEPAEPAKEVAAAKKSGKNKAVSKWVSINTASEAELIAVKGLAAGVARAIVAARPFATLDDVCRAKGMGAKMLAKLRDKLAL
jgi:DNA uptake protein ComE-like DNA-binding protein